MEQCKNVRIKATGKENWYSFELGVQFFEKVSFEENSKMYRFERDTPGQDMINLGTLLRTNNKCKKVDRT